MVQPLVIDFELKPDGFWIIVENISSDPLLSFTASFSKPIKGLPIRGKTPEERTIVSDYELFRTCQYLSPGKRFEFFVENDVTFFKINASEFTILVNVTPVSGPGIHYTIKHNLNIYKQLVQTTSLTNKTN